MLNDSHVHFFSPSFFATLAAQRGLAAADALQHLGWDDPVSSEALADRWVAEMDRHGVSRAAVIASVPGDEASVATAVARHPSRLVGFFMLDPTQPGAESRVVAALEQGLRGVCLFPAMQHFSLRDERVTGIAEIVAAVGGSSRAGRGAVLFVHCGMLTVGARTRLGLPSPFDPGRGNPLDLHPIAGRFPSLPIVIPHFGAGMFREALMLADSCPNVHFDTSSSNGWMKFHPGLTLAQVFSTALGILGHRRLVFGTDSSFFPRGWHRAIYEQQRSVLDGLGVPALDQAAIFGGNFEQLFPPGAEGTRRGSGLAGGG